MECPRLIAISGGMFGGKTEKMIKLAKKAIIAKQKVAIFKPSIDVRYSEDNIISHGAINLKQTTGLSPVVVNNAFELYNSKEYKEADVIFIEEAQFFDKFILKVIREALFNGKGVVCAGLDLDANGYPFGFMGDILAMAQEVYKTTAVCSVCQGDATMSYPKLTLDPGEIKVGGSECYEARCLKCWLLGQTAKKENG